MHRVSGQVWAQKQTLELQPSSRSSTVHSSRGETVPAVDFAPTTHLQNVVSWDMPRSQFDIERSRREIRNTDDVRRHMPKGNLLAKQIVLNLPEERDITTPHIKLFPKSSFISRREATKNRAFVFTQSKSGATVKVRSTTSWSNRVADKIAYLEAEAHHDDRLVPNVYNTWRAVQSVTNGTNHQGLCVCTLVYMSKRRR